MHLISKKVFSEDQRGSLVMVYTGWGRKVSITEGRIFLQRHIDSYDPDDPKQRIILWINMSTIACEPGGRKKKIILFPFTYFVPHSPYTNL